MFHLPSYAIKLKSMFIEKMLQNGDPPQLTWKRKLNNQPNLPSDFVLSIKDIIHLAPTGYRLCTTFVKKKPKERLESSILLLSIT